MSYQQSLLGATTAALGLGFGLNRVPVFQEKINESIAKKKMELEEKAEKEAQKDIQNWETNNPGQSLFGDVFPAADRVLDRRAEIQSARDVMEAKRNKFLTAKEIMNTPEEIQKALTEAKKYGV